MQHKIKGLWLGVLLLSSMNNLLMSAVGQLNAVSKSNLPKGKPAPISRKQFTPIKLSKYNAYDDASVRLANFLKEKLIRPYSFPADVSIVDIASTVPAGSTVAELLALFSVFFPTGTYQQRQQAGHAMKVLMMSLRGVSADDSKLLNLDAELYKYYFGPSKDSNGNILCSQFGCINVISLLQEVMRMQAPVPLHPIPLNFTSEHHLFSSDDVENKMQRNQKNNAPAMNT